MDLSQEIIDDLNYERKKEKPIEKMKFEKKKPIEPIEPEKDDDEPGEDELKDDDMDTSWY